MPPGSAQNLVEGILIGWDGFVSLLSDERVPLEVISRLVGHRSTTVTETVYRKQLRPVIEGGADTMDRIFPPAADSGP
jgi:hypothetical protein